VKIKLKAGLSAALVAAFAGAGLVSLAAPAYAASAPTWEPDGNAAPPYGNIALYDANGVSVTSGTNLSNPFAYAVALTAADTGANKANMNWYDPQHGVAPAGWGGSSESGTTTFSPAASLPAGAPPTVKADAPTDPIVQSTGNITTWLAANTPDTTAGYANIIQVRIQDSGPGGVGNAGGATYWETDIGYNATSAAITVDGTTVPANGWAQLFPFNTAPSSTPTVSVTANGSPVTAGGQIPAGAAVVLTASGVPATPAGSVVFEDNGTAINTATPTGGTATYSFTAPTTNGSHSYTASFVPTLAAETGANSATASQVSSATSAAFAATVQVPQIGTATGLSAGSTSINYGASDTLTASVTEADTPTTTGQTGSVQFKVGAANFGSPVAVTPATAASVQLATGSGATAGPLPSGSDSVTAVYTPTNTGYATSTSAAVVITVAAPAACSLTGSSCTDQQNIQVTVNPGTITITTPYTAANPFVLPAMTLSSDGSFLQSSAAFPATANPAAQQIVVTSSLAPSYAWTLSVSASNLTSSAGTINSSGLGLTGGTLLNATGTGAYSGGVTFTNIAAHNPSPLDPDTNTGLTGTPQSWAHSTAADGTAVIDGTLTLLAPTSTPAGTYTGTVTFTVS
jgi:hypothetical protein